MMLFVDPDDGRPVTFEARLAKEKARITRELTEHMDATGVPPDDPLRAVALRSAEQFADEMFALDLAMLEARGAPKH
jgi:hypothetical protein